MNNPWIIIPTYNEKDNISRLIDHLFTLALDNLTILVVDDNSPDGTSKIIQRLQDQYPKLDLIVRDKKAGLGPAYIHGFTYALDHGATRLVQMDADFSHDPKDVPRLLTNLDQHDLVIGSRFSQGISVINWPLRRLLLSIAANFYVSLITGMPFKDSTGGFKAWRASTLKAINLKNIKADGYGFQVITNHRTWKLRNKIKEIPIIFTERHDGQSKMSNKIIWEAIWLVWKLRFGLS